MELSEQVDDEVDIRGDELLRQVREWHLNVFLLY
jgi:hypothetical protein